MIKSVEISDDIDSAYGGAPGLFLIGIAFFAMLFALSGAAGSVYEPHVGDVVQCDNVLTISGKEIVLDSFGLFDYYVLFDNGGRLALYDYDAYENLPPTGTKIYPRYISQRMRSGNTLESYAVIDAVESNVKNACVVTAGAPKIEPTTCREIEKLDNEKQRAIRATPYGAELVCYFGEFTS